MSEDATLQTREFERLVLKYKTMLKGFTAHSIGLRSGTQHLVEKPSHSQNSMMFVNDLAITQEWKMQIMEGLLTKLAL